MDIKKLLSETYKVGTETIQYKKDSLNRRKPEYVFNRKTFGAIYLNNMVINYKTEEKIIEIVLLMGVSTDIHKSAHRVALALKGVDFQEYNISSLCELIRGKVPSLESTPYNEIIEMILEEGLQPLEGYTVIQKSTTERKFVVVSNNISSSGVDVWSKCSCSDYYYSWAWYNADKGCLIGKRPPAYKRKSSVEGVFTPVRNPNRRPGFCKHLLLLIALLMKGGLIKQLPMLVNNLPNIGAPTSDGEIIDMGTRFGTRLFSVNRRDVKGLLDKLKDELKDLGEIRRGFNY